MINTIQIALSGMNAASKQVEASASNIANMTTKGALKPADGPAPYTPAIVTQSAATTQDGEAAGVRAETIPSTRPFVPSYAPDSPFADADGIVGSPDIDLAEEAVNLQIASHSYKANVKTLNVASEMQDALLNMFDRKA